MKVYFTDVRKVIVISAAVLQLFASSCSRKIHSEASSGHITNMPQKTYTGSYPDMKNVDSRSEIQHPVIEKTSSTDSIYIATEKRLDTNETNAQEIIETARKYFGVPHCMGGTTMKCMDCSGLLVTVFREHDIILPHNAQEQSKYGVTIKKMDDLREGDLVFFAKSYKTRNYITHSGIYIGDFKFIHTSSSKGVSVTSLYDRYWHGKFVFGKRILE